MSSKHNMFFKREIRGAKAALDKAINPLEPSGADYADAFRIAKTVATQSRINDPIYIVYHQDTKKLICLSGSALLDRTDIVIIRIFIKTPIGVHSYSFKDGNFL